MNVTISVAGKFHAFYLADQLQKRGHLRRLITTYPKFEVAKYGIDPARVTSLWWLEALGRVAPRLGVKKEPVSVAKKALFQRLVPALLPADTDLYVGWSGSALNGIRTARKRGIRSLLVRGSSHILHQTEVLRREYADLGMKPKLPDARVIQTELAEYEEADFIYNQTDFARKTFLNHGVSQAKLVQTPTGVNLEHFYQVPKTDDVFRIIFCGALSVRKGLRYLLQAFGKLNIENAELWLIGARTGESDALLERFGSKGVICKGVHPERELHRLYCQGSVFCLPSLEEGLAMVQAQAMACGLPLICTESAGGGEFLRYGNGGICLDGASVDGLVEALRRLHQNPGERLAMGANAMRIVRDRFTWDHYGDRICEIYEKIL